MEMERCQEEGWGWGT
jgi:hypothetical protein